MWKVARHFKTRKLANITLVNRNEKRSHSRASLRKEIVDWKDEEVIEIRLTSLFVYPYSNVSAQNDKKYHFGFNEA